ncbi:VOC family protein [Pseudomonas sp. Irchel 3A5]|uniref:VOC family protein n=1 Tax=Pseudomonas sp. Irchel 3A5 TaxID=2008911 RepID=UPI000BA4C734|nr:VOC family protein [Pseudomonas sp. Irchel 3A5]
MLDHIFLSVSNIARSISFYEGVLVPLGITGRLDYDGKDGPPGHPDLKGFGANGRVFFWLREGVVEGRAVHIGFVANSKAEVEAAYDAAIKQGAIDNGPPGARLHYDPAYYAANVLDPDGYSLEFVYKNWQHTQ